jgi:phosphodiesterase/alkaline phosphatase D-like protein
MTVDEIAISRYRVVRTAYWWRVKVGDGARTVGRCFTEAEAERLAAELRTAFLDGAFVERKVP